MITCPHCDNSDPSLIEGEVWVEGRVLAWPVWRPLSQIARAHWAGLSGFFCSCCSKTFVTSLNP